MSLALGNGYNDSRGSSIGLLVGERHDQSFLFYRGKRKKESNIETGFDPMIYDSLRRSRGEKRSKENL